MEASLYIAVDLGAGSGRVFLVGLATGELLLEEVRRFRYPPGYRSGHLRWDFLTILEEIKTGAQCAGARARELRRPIQSIGVDSWAVDYGLLDEDGNLIESPVCYRDARTQGIMETVFAQVSREEIYERTGIQFLEFNTLYQVYAHSRMSIPAAARRLLLIPDLINFFLTGRAVTEYTNATTTQLVSAQTGRWDRELMNHLNLPADLFTEIVSAATDLGMLEPALASELGLDGVRVVATATHDTASAVAGAPIEAGWGYVSSGTWSLVGVELESALINSEVARHNFTNEGGALGTIRFLKNVMGLWIFESCRKEWKERGMNIDYEDLIGQSFEHEETHALIFPDDSRFFNPPSMLDAIAAQLAESGQPIPADPSTLARAILDSLAFRYASVLRAASSLTGHEITGAQIVGGGSQNDYLNQATATAAGLAVLAGPAEATVTGNALVQAIASGRFASLKEAREHVARNIRLKKFAPRPSPAWEEKARRYAEIESRYAG